MPGKSIMIADDDAGMVEFIATALQTSGCEVDSVTSTEDLVKKLRSATPDLILLDMGMPGLDEKTPAVDVRKRTLTRAKIVVLTGRDIAAERKAGHLQGTQGAIQKASGMDAIVATVQEMLK